MSGSPSGDAVRAEIRARLGRLSTTTPGAAQAGAAVLIVLRPDPAGKDIETLLMQRTVRPEDAASGQVSLPGGRVDVADRDLRSTALRETEEEVGLLPSDFVGTPRFFMIRPAVAFGLTVGIFAVELAAEHRPPHARSSTEVAEVFWLPRRALEPPERVLRDTSVGAREVTATTYDGHIVWGFTHRVLRLFFGWEDDGSNYPFPPAVAPAGPPWQDGGPVD